MEKISNSPEETYALGKLLGGQSKPGQVYCLDGDLGVGKTIFTQGFAAGLGIDEPVNSPTFTIVQQYDSGRLPLYHFDVYRIGDVSEMDEIGYEDCFYGEGVCLIEGMDTTVEENLWDIRQHVGMVFQNPDNQIVAAIVEEDVAFGPENIGVPTAEIRTRVDAALAAVGMSDYAKHAPHLLSGGQKQRVAIAGVLALEPKCIVLDEPTAMLDPQGRKEIVTTVKKLNREKGITVVYITHYMEEALQADRIIVMGEGKLKMQGTPKEVFSHVRELYALGLEAPLAAKIADDLRQSGLNLQQGIITNEELAESICR